MKEKINERIKDEYSVLYDEMVEAEKKVQAIGRSKFSNRFGTALLLGMIPSLVCGIVLAFILKTGLLSAATTSLLSVLTTTVASGITLYSFEKKWGMKKEREDYNVPKGDAAKYEKEIEADEYRRKCEVETKLLKDYYEKINSENFEFKNLGYNKDEEETILENDKEELEKTIARQYVNDKFGEYRSGKKNPFKSSVCGALLGAALALIVMYLPQLFAGIGITSLVFTPATIAVGALSTLSFATYAGVESYKKKKLYKKKNKALGSRALPEGTDFLYMENHNLVSAAYNKCLDTMTRLDASSLPVEQKDVKEEETVTLPKTLVKEEAVVLEKKI